MTDPTLVLYAFLVGILLGCLVVGLVLRRLG